MAEGLARARPGPHGGHARREEHRADGLARRRTARAGRLLLAGGPGRVFEGDHFYRRVVPSPAVFPDSRQPDRHSIPIALGPAQFNEFYR
jgi:hypothetical protein